MNTDSDRQPDAESTTPLERRAIEIDVAQAFLSVLEEDLAKDAAARVFQRAVDRLAADGAFRFRDENAPAGLAELWKVWQFLGGGGRLDMHLDSLTDDQLRFHVDHCAYADLYRSRGQEAIGIAFSCRRDEPFAKALVPGVKVEQSTTILEGSARCEFTYTLEHQ